VEGGVAGEAVRQRDQQAMPRMAAGAIVTAMRGAAAVIQETKYLARA